MPQENFVIKKGILYLHATEEKLVFKKERTGASIFGRKESEIVLNTLGDAGVTQIFKARVKTKYVSTQAQPNMDIYVDPSEGI